MPAVSSDLSAAAPEVNESSHGADHWSPTTASLFILGPMPADDSQSSFYLVQPHQYALAMKFILALQITITTGGLLANVVSIRTFFVMGLKDCVTITFFNLAISDFTFLLLFCVDIAVKVHHTVFFGRDRFPPIFGMDAVDLLSLVWKCHDPLVRTSLIFIAFLATQRSLCVIRPLQFKGMFTPGRTVTIVSIIWVYNLLFAATQFSMLTIVKSPLSSTNESRYVLQYRAIQISSWMEFINDTTLTVVCDVAVIGGLVVMTLALKGSVRFRKSASSVLTEDEVDTDKAGNMGTSNRGGKFDKERQAIVQVAILSAVFLMAWIPNFILPIASSIQPKLQGFGYYFFRQICVQINAVFALANASINFLVYYKYNTRFRQVLLNEKIK